VLRDEFGMSLEPPLLGKAEFQAIPGSMPTPVELRILPPNDR
jgi:hypothetical protein